jgi:NADP-dependent 3-hydroxy acid dehydrogenase YdfG
MGAGQAGAGTTAARAGPVGIITGGASGIGAASAVAFARLGARLVLATLPTSSTQAVTALVERAGGQAVTAHVDVRDPRQVATLPEVALRHYGRIDFLLVNAGVAEQSRSSEGDPDVWRNVIETNLLGALYCVRYVLPQMRAQQSGHIILMASLSGREPYVGEPAYIASKWGVVGFGHSLRKEVLADHIRVTLVEPGIVDTPLTRGNPVVRPLLDAVVPLQAEDVARAVVYAFRQPPHVTVSEIAVRPQGEGETDVPLR